MSDKQAAVIYGRVTRRVASRSRTNLSSFVAGQGSFVPCIFHVFFDKLSNKPLWLFCLFVFPNEIAFSSILRNDKN